MFTFEFKSCILLSAVSSMQGESDTVIITMHNYEETMPVAISCTSTVSGYAPSLFQGIDVQTPDIHMDPVSAFKPTAL